MRVLARGIPASPGRAEGKARVVVKGDGSRVEPGEILVTLITDASMFADIIENAQAIVTDLGGVTSHPAIVARELGIPCVVRTGSATKTIATGTHVVVDGDQGVVYEPC